MNLTVLLADFAQGGDGAKVNALGLGWSRIGTPLGLHSVLLVIDLEPAELGTPHHIALELVDVTGRTVIDPAGQRIEASAEVLVHLDEGATVPGVQMITVNLTQGLPLDPGVYAWEAHSPSAPGAVWRRPFEVFAAA
ncbi:DUF6941 family protein [Actinokineospora enzanensis]|uniref:DUF6941 family protein n=1 Tax=Actinokineospora enzanensis TaxID=155975 RepID=UPI000371C497|nr:hypothetical protein [Actinokineospora enzanensis]